MRCSFVELRVHYDKVVRLDIVEALALLVAFPVAKTIMAALAVLRHPYNSNQVYSNDYCVFWLYGCGLLVKEPEVVLHLVRTGT